jgi:hypothetical protein
MATARSSQSHQKRVQQIVDDAAEKIAENSPLEEDVVVVVEELPPGDTRKTHRARSTTDESASAAMFEMVAQSQKLVADGVSRWIEMTTAHFGKPTGAMEIFGEFFDPRRLTEESFRLAEGLLASQKAFTMKVVDVFSAARAA